MNILQGRVQLHSHHDMYSPGGFRLEDDAFYNELSKGVLQLLEDDDGGFNQNKNPNVVAGGWKHGEGRFLKQQNYYDWPVEGEVLVTTTPTWLMNMWGRSAETGGTGVFIPQQVQAQQVQAQQPFQPKKPRCRSKKKNQQRQGNQQGRAIYRRKE